MGVSLALFSGTHGRGLGSCVKPSGFPKKARARHASQLTSATLQYHTPLYVAHYTWCGTTVLSRKHSEALVNADCNTYRTSPILRGQAVQPYKRHPCSSSTPMQGLHTQSGAPRGVADKHCAALCKFSAKKADYCCSRRCIIHIS